MARKRPARRRFVPRRGPFAALLVIVLLTAGCSLPELGTRGKHGRIGAAGPAGSAPDWRRCPETANELVGRGAPNMIYECATIAVPHDWHTAGTTSPGTTAGTGNFEIALLRARSTKQRDRIGSLLLNPGGPGGSGIDTAVYLSFGSAFGGLPDEVTRRFDIVGFDPRGVSRSSPIKCISDADLDASFGYDPDPRSDAEFNGLVTLDKRIGENCADRYGDRLRLFGTEQAARDMDAIRSAVGDDKLTYLGYSYGTLLGATYAQLFPANVRAMVLDGAVDPQQDVVAGSESQAKGFERAFDNFTAWCARTPAKCPIAPDARAAVTSALDTARVSPARNSSGRAATPGWVFYAVISSLYTESGWQRLASAINELNAGDPKKVFELADEYTERDANGKYSNLFDANLAVNCADEGSTPDAARIRALQSQWRSKYPLFGAALATGMLTCAYWPGQRAPYPTGPATAAPPILVIGTTGDPATPYEQAPKLADQLAVGVLLTWEGEGHTAYPQTRCVTAAVNAYLVDRKVPSEGLRCPAK